MIYQTEKDFPLTLWGTELSEDVLQLARERILDGGNLATREDLPKRTVKMALIAIKYMNPLERLTQEEEAILMGVSRDTLRKLKKEGLNYPHSLNVRSELVARLRAWAVLGELRAILTAAGHELEKPARKERAGLNRNDYFELSFLRFCDNLGPGSPARIWVDSSYGSQAHKCCFPLRQMAFAD